jgi:hypothetical protein
LSGLILAGEEGGGSDEKEEASLLPSGPSTAGDTKKGAAANVWPPARLAKRLFEGEGSCEAKPDSSTRAQPGQLPGKDFHASSPRRGGGCFDPYCLISIAIMNRKLLRHGGGSGGRWNRRAHSDEHPCRLCSVRHSRGGGVDTTRASFHGEPWYNGCGDTATSSRGGSR